MLRLSSIILLLFVCPGLSAQSVIWSHSNDGEHYDRCISLVSDNNSSFYSVIYRHSGGQSGYNDTYGFLRKQAANGHTIWEKKVDPGYYGNIGSVKTDHQGNLYWELHVWGGANFNSDTTLQVFGTSVVRLDTNGVIRGVDSFFDRVFCDTDIDDAGNKYFFGKHDGSVAHFNDDSIQFASGKPFFVMVDPAGEIVWYQEFENDSYQGGHMNVRKIGNRIYFASDFSGTLKIGNAVYSNTSNSEAFIGAIDVNGNDLWSRTFGSPATERISFIDALDDPSLVLVGFESSWQYDAVNVTIDNITAHGKSFLCMFNGNGSLEWLRSTPEKITSSAFADSVFYITGNDLVVGKYDLSGRLRYSRHETVNGGAVLPLKDDLLLFGGEIFRTNFLGTFIPWYNYYSNRTDLLICKLNFIDFDLLPKAKADTSSSGAYCLGGYASFINLCENADSIRWFIPKAQPASGCESLMFTFSDTGFCDLTVIAYKDGFSDTVKYSNFYKINPLPEITVIGNFNACYGDTISLTAAYLPGMTYLWSNNDTSRFTQFTPGSWYCTLNVFQNGCYKNQSFYFNYITIPKPVITRAGQQLEISIPSAQYASAQWFLNDTAISSTGSTCQLFTSGSYTVLITDTNGCSAMSDPYIIRALGLAESDKQQIRISPNPADEKVMIEGVFDKGSIILLYDIEGRRVKEDFHVEGRPFHFEDVSPGIYHLVISSSTERFSHKLIIQR